MPNQPSEAALPLGLRAKYEGKHNAIWHGSLELHWIVINGFIVHGWLARPTGDRTKRRTREWRAAP